MKKAAISTALRMLREAGVVIPRNLTRRINNKNSYIPGRRDLKRLKKRLMDLKIGQRLVIGLKKDRLSILTFDGYLAYLKTAEHARKFNHTGK